MSKVLRVNAKIAAALISPILSKDDRDFLKREFKKEEIEELEAKAAKLRSQMAEIVRK